jgi:HlyD family secretion protein
MKKTSFSFFLFFLPFLFILSCQGTSSGTAIHASGHIEATEVRLAAKVGGRLAELPFLEGDAVKTGDVVAKLETVDAQNDLARARADFDGADARLRLLQAGARKEDIMRASAEVARVEADVTAAKRDLVRVEGLASKGSATTKSRDDARTRVEMLERGLAAVNAELAKLKAGARPQEIDQARAQRAASAALVATIEQRIKDATVVTPRSGVITQRTVEPGEVIPPGGLLCILTDIASPWLNVYVDEPSLSNIHLGDAATVRVDGQTQDFVGKVTFISPLSEFTPKNVQTPEERAKLVFRVKITLDNSKGIFKPGMPADAFFSPTSKHSEQIRETKDNGRVG